MASAFDDYPPMSFAGISFLVEKMTIKGGMRNHTHEYPHVPGGNNELLARQLYRITADVVFVTGIEKYPNAYPGDLNDIRALFEAGTIDELVLPNIGSIQAHAIDWDQELSEKMRNGERCHFEFIEDATIENIVATPLDASYTNVASSYSALVLVANDNGVSLDLFAQVQDLVNQITSYREQADLYADLIATKAEQLANALRDLDEADDFDDPSLFEIVEAMQTLGVAADNLAKDALSKIAPIAFFEVPIEMTISEVSIRIYGDTTHSVELLQLNAIEDALAIRAGTTITYYAFPGALLAA